MSALEALVQLPSAWLYAGAAVFGACVGSFLNVVVYRLPRSLSLAHPPSTCPACQSRIAPYDNVPVLSWLLLRGRCRRCRAPIPVRYPALELGTAALAVLCLAQFGPGPQAAAMFTFLAAMGAVALIDWEHMIIPDSISLGFLGLGLAISPWIGPGLVASLIGAVVGGGLLLAVAVLWKKARGVDAMGGGDIKLMAAVGAFCGAVDALLVIFLGAGLGAIFGAVILRRGGQARIAFGTFLSAATFVIVFFGDELIAWYLRTSGLVR
jgi:leader peptidase (prepilin peptidase)/N-methyltransferase